MSMNVKYKAKHIRMLTLTHSFSNEFQELLTSELEEVVVQLGTRRISWSHNLESANLNESESTAEPKRNNL